jgi:hypothetical protein
MFNQARYSSRDAVCRKPILTKREKFHLEPGWYGPESLKEIQQIFDAVWLDIGKFVFPWDVHAARERLAILVFQQVNNPDGDMKHIKKRVMQSWARMRRPHPVDAASGMELSCA